MSLSAQSSLTLAEWRAAVASPFGSLQVNTEDPEGFRADLRVVTVGDVSLFDMRTPAHTVDRIDADIPGDVIPHCKLSLQMEGESTLAQDGRHCVLRPGDLALYVTQRPYRLSYPGAQHSLVVHFPESFVQMTPDQIAQVTAVPIAGNEGLGRVAVPLFEQIALNFEVLTGPYAGSLLRSALDMLVTVLSSELSQADGPLSNNLLFQQAIAYIDRNLDNTELSPRMIAEALFVSVRHLHSQFSSNGLTISAYIRGRRLELIRRDLADPLHVSESIQSIGTRYGLSDSSQVSRLFRSEFGESPSGYRTRMMGSQ
ncbi:Transcriptional activator NphR [Corynebacterium atrinae]|uniref:AraC-like ligand-binding domain-containing protein n=1 Tax=Corynebacterium atrinae TaxID=1336740 RepID=UPI0025B60CB6|nr:helix-turn-helix domain-containing protein [Corynebacterium atrinae]WJY62301.1 Transcriptional activator NphR [Corynebacterium atrinae]